MNRKHIIALLKKDFLLETRQQHSFYAVVLYLLSTVFVVYLSVGTAPEQKIWNALFWIVQLFVCINAVAKSFLSESHGRMIYYFCIVNPKNFVIAKLIYNTLLMLLMCCVAIIVFLLFLENPFEHILKFIGISFLGSFGLSLVFTFLAAIAAKAKQQASLMAIMGLPVIIPQLLLLFKISTVAFSSVLQDSLWQMVGILVALDLMIVALAVILFRYLWKD